MKKLAVLLGLTVFIALSSASFAQKVGFKMGVSFANVNIGDDDEYIENKKALIAPHLGFPVDIPVYEGMYIHTGLMTRASGFRYESERFYGDVFGGNFEIKDSREMLIIWYLDFPLYFGYKYQMDEVSFFGMAGPYFDYGVYSTILYKGEGKDWDNEKVKFGEPNDDDQDVWLYLNNWDVGLGIEAGVQYNRFQLSLAYRMGFSDILYVPEDWEEYYEDKWKNTALDISLGIVFGNVDGGSRRGGWR